MEFVYDRTQADVDRAVELNKRYLEGKATESEKAEWESGIKGALNLSDINRVESNIGILSGLLATLVDTKSWSYGDIPRVSDYGRILYNLKKIRDAWFTLSGTPDIPEQPLNSYQKWNDIEKILHDLNYTYQGYVNSFCYCGAEIYAGDNVGDL